MQLRKDGLTQKEADLLYLRLDTTNDPLTGLLTGNLGAVFNETGVDSDLRVEAVGQQNALFVQGSDGFFALGNNAPSNHFHMTSATEPFIRLESTSAIARPNWYMGIGRGGQFSHGTLFISEDTPSAANYEIQLPGSGILRIRERCASPVFASVITGRGESPIMEWTNDGGNFNGTLKLGQRFGSGISNVEVYIGPATGTFNIRNQTGTNFFTVDAANGVIVNEAGNDQDLRIEGVGQANAYLLQGSDGFSGFNTGTPRAQVDVVGDIYIGGSNNELRFYEGANYVGFEAPALSADQIWVLPDSDGSTNDIVKTDGSGNLAFVTPTVNIPIAITMYDAEPARGSETNVHGGLLSLATGQPLNTVPTNIVVTKGIGKIMVVVNAGGDISGDITVTGESIDRETGASTPADTDTLTVDALTTDNSDTDTNGNTRHAFTGAYITSKWFTGSVTLSTTNLTLTDVDVYHVSFEQFDDNTNLTLDTFDANIFTTNVNAEFDAYLYSLEVTGDKCDIAREASLNVGADGETAIANKYWRLRRGNIAKTLNGSTDGIWADIHYSNSPAYVEDVTLKIWVIKSQTLTLT